MWLNHNFKNKKVFVTGHSGFKGSWLSLWLSMLGADVLGYSLEPNTSPSLFEILKFDSQIKTVVGDIRDKDKISKAIKDFQPEIVFHLAAQPLVRLSYSDPVTTYETNVLGTLNVLEAARHTSSVRAFVNVTSDKCYENKEINYGYRESDSMGGYDMYSSSKGCAEILTASYRQSFLKDGTSFVLASARAGNVIGGGDWAQDRLIPDCVKSLSNKQNIIIRNPIAVRPWQHVLEPLSGYLLLGQKLLEDGRKYAEGFNFGPYNDGVLTVKEIAEKVVSYWGDGNIIIEKNDNLHEANLLQLNIDKAQEVLGWAPVCNADEAIKLTIEWYKRFYSGENMHEFTVEQISNYQKKILKSNVLM